MSHACGEEAQAETQEHGRKNRTKDGSLNDIVLSFYEQYDEEDDFNDRGNSVGYRESSVVIARQSCDTI